MDNDLIKKTIEDILAHMSVSVVNIDIIEGQFGVVFDIHTDACTILTEKDGENLLALSHVVKRIAGNGIDKERKNFTIDADGFQENKNNEIKERVNMFAEKARSLKADVEMDPMNSYERMIAHTVLADIDGLETESAGVGRDRHVVIRFNR